MPYRDDIRAQRVQIQRLGEALVPIEAGVACNTAAALIGRARALLRAADQNLATAAREPVDADTIALEVGQ